MDRMDPSHLGGSMRFLGTIPARRVLAAVLLTGIVVIACDVQHPAAAENPTAPVLASGEVPGGADVVGVTVTIDPKDAVLRVLKVGETAPPVLAAPVTATFSGSRYAVRLDPTTIPSTYMSRDGVIFAMVTVTLDGSAPVSTMTSARAVADPATGNTAWVDALQSTEAVAESGTARIAGRALPAITGVDAASRAAENEGVRVASDQYDALFRSNYTETPPGCSDTKIAQRIRDTTIGTTYPVGHDKAGMDVNSSTGASYGTALSIKNRYSGVFADFKAASSKYTKSGWGFSWDGSSAQRSYRKGILYGKFLRDRAQGCRDCFMFWKPIGETGGTGSNTQGVNRPDWGHCVPIDTGIWWRDAEDGHNYDYDAAVKFADVIGIDLSISREYNSSQKIWYRTPGGRRMCGNNDLPSKAGKVMERR